MVCVCQGGVGHAKSINIPSILVIARVQLNGAINSFFCLFRSCIVASRFTIPSLPEDQVCLLSVGPTFKYVIPSFEVLQVDLQQARVKGYDSYGKEIH